MVYLMVIRGCFAHILMLCKDASHPFKQSAATFCFKPIYHFQTVNKGFINCSLTGLK